jgi:glycosyltransferase involved in cell wall biosynthesis
LRAVPRVLMALSFFPRGGSAQVARYVARELPQHGWDVTLVAGSLGGEDEASNARSFFSGIDDVRPVDYTESREADDPLRADPPFQPSYEDRPDAPDVVYAKVGDEDFERLVALWEGVLRDAGAADADVLHLHHLTPLNEAAARAFPDKPVVGHLHGTEILMLNAIEEGPPEGWEHARAWADRLRGWAQAADRLFVLSPDAVEHVPELFGVDPAKVVWAPNGFEPELFDRRPADPDARRALWRSWLVDEPRGWDESGEAGSIRYREDDLEALDGPVLLYVGRYTEVKRLPLLVRAWARAQPRFEQRAGLVLIGGYPGEWEGEHPWTVVQDEAASDVFLAGWHGHEDLPDGLNASDCVVLPSVHEQFGQVLVEGMACGLPCVAVDAHGPATIVDDGETGWLVPPDDEEALAEAIVEVVNDSDERRRRGAAAYDAARAKYSWPSLVEGVAAVYRAAAEGQEPGGDGPQSLTEATG